jgi:hypothetical protein
MLKEKTKLELKKKEDHWEGTFTPDQEGTYRLGMNDQQPVLLRSKNPQENVRPIDFMCGAYSVGSSLIYRLLLSLWTFFLRKRMVYIPFLRIGT